MHEYGERFGLERIRLELRVFQAYFCRAEPLLKAVGLFDDAVSMKMFMNGVFKHMESMISFCAIKEGTNDLVGVLVASMFEKSQWYIKKELYSIVKHVLVSIEIVDERLTVVNVAFQQIYEYRRSSLPKDRWVRSRFKQRFNIYQFIV